MRISEWASKIPFIALMFTVIVMVSGFSPEEVVWEFFICISYSVLLMLFGYAVNDYSDIDADISAGKDNIFKDTPVGKRKIEVSILALSLLFPLIIHPNLLMAAVIVLNLFIATFYSLRPIRFKERGILGLIVSSFAQRCSPLLLMPVMMAVDPYIFAACCVIGFFLGIRYILIHQIIDSSNDSRTGTATFFLKNVSASRRWIYISFAIESLTSVIVMVMLPFGNPFVPIVLITMSLITEVFVITTLRSVGMWPFFDYVYVPLMSVYTTFLPLSVIICSMMTYPGYLWYVLVIFLTGCSLFVKNLITLCKAVSADIKIRRERRFDASCSGICFTDGMCLLNVDVEGIEPSSGNRRIEEDTRVIYSPVSITVTKEQLEEMEDSGRYHIDGVVPSDEINEAMQTLDLPFEEFCRPGDIYSFRRNELRGTGIRSASDIPSFFLEKPRTIPATDPSMGEQCGDLETFMGIWCGQLKMMKERRPELFINIFPLFLTSALLLTFLAGIGYCLNGASEMIVWWSSCICSMAAICFIARLAIMRNVCDDKGLRRMYLRKMGIARFSTTRIYTLKYEFTQGIIRSSYAATAIIIAAICIVTAVMI